jgi:hypothetical protein
MTVKELKTNNMPDPLNAAGNEQTMPKGKKTYGYTKKMTKIKRIINKNNIILRKLDKQPEYVFETIPQL